MRNFLWEYLWFAQNINTHLKCLIKGFKYSPVYNIASKIYFVQIRTSLNSRKLIAVKIRLREALGLDLPTWPNMERLGNIYSFLQEQFYKNMSLKIGRKLGNKLRTRLSLKPCLKMYFWTVIQKFSTNKWAQNVLS